MIMSACWPLQDMSATQKAVLISLADNANDEGVCWPSVPKIAMRTCLSERAVQGSIRWLCSTGILSTAERLGRSTLYTLTPAAYAPPQQPRPADAVKYTPQELHPSPAQAAPPPRSSCTQNRNRTYKEPSAEPPAFLPARFGQSIGEAGEKVSVKTQKEPDDEDRKQACRNIWLAYSTAYFDRYQTEPVRNQKVNAQVNDLLKRLGKVEAPGVAAYFVGINDSYLIRECHAFGALLAKAEAFRTQWATNAQVNSVTARQIENTQANLNTAEQAKAMIRKEGSKNAFL
ncbi:helix-turn-helix domain-containing protein [Pseudomonas sp. UYIF39]|uniref:helix-turn-helix domain-containing protein n=1 Tax=Pseudomonas sp. UYIF39 TaxID=1630747 RepID=UPI00249F160F|nr:helix-turn-helix domain-containing protein [Pseudomonas sp. UYIF39]MDI3356541.1 helix-turn-helix domain-containing protein [Pseudomonas sp. UYIF39]